MFIYSRTANASESREWMRPIAMRHAADEMYDRKPEMQECDEFSDFLSILHSPFLFFFQTT